MEVDPLASHPPLATRTNPAIRQPPQRGLSTRSQRTQKAGALREARSRRSPPRPMGRGLDPSAKSKARLSPITAVKPLLPAAERRPAGEDGKVGKAKKEVEGEKWDITPDGGSAGREGRQFTVANVGNNGKIYLRPTVRPANQRYPQPTFVFPITPPTTAGLDALTSAKEGREEMSELHGSQWTSTPLTAPSFDPRSLPRRPHHRRAMSDSTVHEASIAHEPEIGGFKVVISKPQDESKAKTTEDIDPSGGLLQISIPSWRLGTPRFTRRGTPIICGSSCAPTEDNRSSNVSFFHRSQRGDAGVNSLHPESPSTIMPSPIMMPPIGFPCPRLLSPSSPRFPGPTRATYLSTHLVIEPAMFDFLTFKPTSDDRSIVRYSSTTGAVTAATPPRLVAEITSPSFLDYELISDFFLTFRAFMDTADLLRMLIARVKWALCRDDEIGMVVRVRTFVAMRHWILNYFVDDFVVDYHLRVTFCNLLNDFVEELSSEPRGRKMQLKILAELKKCWRRVCLQYWDGPEFNSNLGPEIPIAPGGIAGHRNPSLDPSFWENDNAEAPQICNFDFLQSDPRTDTSFYIDVDNAGHIDTILHGGERPRTPEQPSAANLGRRVTSPTSIASLDVVSCSFPTKGLRMPGSTASHPLGAHPVDPSSIYTGTDPVASTPRALTGKRVRPQPPPHKRNNSLTDSLREHATTTEKVLYKNAEFLLTLPYAGSLVRGNLLPPGQPFVEVAIPDSSNASRETTVFQPYPADVQKEKGASAMSSQGMKRLIGSVRKALSHKGPGIPTTQGSFLNIAPIGPRGVTTNRIPGTAIVPQARPARPNGFRPAVRIDMLGAGIAEEFKKAVREDTAGEDDVPAKVTGENIEYSAAHLDSSFELDHETDDRPLSDTAITAGSKSIVIVDGTLPPEVPTMTGALPPLPVLSPSVEDFADSFLVGGGADPTPPNTPPGRAGEDIPRRSSYILGQHAVQPTSADVPLPLFIPDLSTLGSGRPSQDMNTDTRPSIDRPSMGYVTQPPNRPPLSSSRYQGHKRQKSSRSFRSNGSLALRRWASFHSAFPQSTVRSFDATTYSEGSIASEIMPPPQRVLRRRPGGDLRGAQNVADLDALPLHKSRSVGSLTTYSESLRSSYLRSPVRDSSGYVGVVSSDYSHNRGEVFSLGAVADKAPKRRVSYFSTHSSKPIMRPSFEAEAQKLAQIPDDANDDGGVESALAKLEGKVAKTVTRLSMEPRCTPVPDMAEIHTGSAVESDEDHLTPEKRKHRHQHVGDEDVLPLPSPTNPAHPGSLTTLQLPQSSDVISFLSDGSKESYNSVPLLERGLTDDGRSKTDTRQWTNQSVLQDADDLSPAYEMPEPSSSVHPSYEIVKKSDSIRRILPGETAPRPSKVQSFLEVDSDNDSDLSSELSLEVIESDELGVKLASETKRPGTIDTEIPANINAEAHRTSEGHPPSPPMTLVQALRASPETALVPELHEHQVWSQKPLPPTPETTPTAALYHQHLVSPADSTGAMEALGNAPKIQEQSGWTSSVHLPFILAFDSDILAQQFTLIEKDALNEVDWKELIDMRWKNSHSDSRSWVDFLRNSDARGVEVVVARFNIMVKWAISEIVLTQDDAERARCLIKYLHIAAHCRRYRNFATTSQIAIALTSNEVARLTRTWRMLPPQDLKTMGDLETLVSPTKNFYNLRAEMEGGATAADMGCIPFVGIYTHDLLFNSQRPSEIASSPSTAPLVNFERFRIAASVVKTLLRLLEASALYQFQPIEGITERCLWMSALNDDEIRRHSESIEPSLA
ncbi:RasGEF domain-containing protein [Xylariales sp. AK1849]|nr:RasGEF domain-containing protein [Xylariales sp. AK1849]